jgi:Family of unknown function (DUF5995)
VIQHTAQELRSIARNSTDATGYFPALYARVTSNVAAAIAAGRFEDGERMDTFATTFASYYLRAMRAEIPRPRCWQATRDVANDNDLLIVQHLLLGINAHVNHDLAQAVVDAADATGDLTAARRDFDAINNVLESASTEVLRDLDRVSRWVNKISALGGGRGFNFSLRVARARAWDAAQHLYPLNTEGRTAYIGELDRLVSVVAYLITRPSFPASLFVKVTRRLEQRDPTTVTTALLGET